MRVTLTRSPYGRKPKQTRTLEALGLRKVGQSREFEVSDSVRGMVKVVSHLVDVEEKG